MSRQKEERLTDEEIIETYKPKVFGIYAKLCLIDLVDGEDSNPRQISHHRVHHNGTVVKRIIRVLYENDVFTHLTSNGPVIDVGRFLKEAPSFAKLNLNDFNLNLEGLFLNHIKKHNSYDKSQLSEENLPKIGTSEINNLSTPTALWAFFNPDKVAFLNQESRYDHTIYLKDHIEEMTKSQLLAILFDELKKSPTEYLAKFTGTKWVGQVSNCLWNHDHGALDIIKDPLQISRAERDLRKKGLHLTAYADMLCHIKKNMKGNRVEKVTEFFKFMINDMIKRSPLKLSDFRYKHILENAPEFTFENLFPFGLTEEQIKSTLNKI